MSKFISVMLAVLALSSVNASVTTTSSAAENAKVKNSILFQVIQIQVTLDSSTIESGEVVPSKDSHGYGIQLKLNKKAADQFASITEGNIGKRINIVLNDRIISSPILRSKLGNEFLVVGLTQEEAEKFIRDLK